jgi:cytochrome bd-type quinol oxidase subunit 2
VDGVTPLVLVVVGCVLVALVVGVVANRYVRPFAKSEVQGVKLEALINPAMTLAVLLLAFILVQVFASYVRAKESAGDEARKVDYLFEVSGFTPEPIRADLRAAVTCYARAVAVQEWPGLSEGRASPAVGPWTGELREAYQALAAQSVDQPFPIVLATDKERGEARSRRLTEARPAVPVPLTVLMVLASTVAIAGLGTFTLPSVRRRVQIGAITALAGMLILVQVTIIDIDRPYDGLIAVTAIDMERVAADLAEDYAEDYPQRALPCDPAGNPT